MNCHKGFRNFCVIFFFFFTGAFYPVINGLILKQSFPWKDDLQLRFSKPWFQVLALNFGMVFFGIKFIFEFIRKECKKNTVYQQTFSWATFRKSGLPAILYIIASVLQTYSLIYMPPSVWQIFHGFQVLFTTLFAVTVLKQRLFLVDWLGVFMNVLGLSFTGVATLLRGITKKDDEISTMFLMLILAIISHGVKSYQTVLEEKILKETKIPSSDLTAYEGFWGFFALVFVCLPGIMALPITSPFYENTIEAFVQFYYSKVLSTLFALYIIFVVLFTYCGILVTQYNTAIRRNMYETIRPLFVWIISVSAPYIVKSVDIGEDLDKYTAIELTGFAISIVGSLIYNRVWRCGCFIYAEHEQELLQEEISISLLNNSSDVPTPTS